VEVNRTHSLSSALDGGEESASCPGRFTPQGKSPSTHWVGGWVDPRAGLHMLKRKLPPPLQESNPDDPIVQPVASRYTDWIIPAHDITLTCNNFQIVSHVISVIVVLWVCKELYWITPHSILSLFKSSAKICRMNTQFGIVSIRVFHSLKCCRN
jgi:hypothetical protein